MVKIAITGANGFIGSALCRRFEKNAIRYEAVMRNGNQLEFEQIHGNTTALQSYQDRTTLSSAFKNSTSVVHLAAKVHQPDSHELDIYLHENVELTSRVLEACADAGVTHFILMSSVAVFGQEAASELNVESACKPQQPYGVSKFKAEQAAIEFCREKNIFLDVIRVPVVIGGIAKGTLGMLDRFSFFPIPFASIKNRRSVVKLETLTAYIENLCLSPQNGQVGTLHILAEQQPLSTPDLLRLSNKCRGRKIFLVPFPVSILMAMLWCLDAISSKRKSGFSYVKKILHDCVVVPGKKRIL